VHCHWSYCTTCFIFLVFLFDLQRRASNHLGKGSIYRDIWCEAVPMSASVNYFLPVSVKFCVAVRLGLGKSSGHHSSLYLQIKCVWYRYIGPYLSCVVCGRCRGSISLTCPCRLPGSVSWSVIIDSNLQWCVTPSTVPRSVLNITIYHHSSSIWC
jgi:hypothetical protein